MAKDELRALVAGLSEGELEELGAEIRVIRGNKKLRRKLVELKEREASGGVVFHGTFKQYLNKVDLDGYGDEKNDPYVYDVVEEGDHDHLSRATHSTFDDHYVDWGGGWPTENSSSTLERDWTLPA